MCFQTTWRIKMYQKYLCLSAFGIEGVLKVNITILYGIFIAVGGVYFSAYEGRLPGVFLAAFAKMPASASRRQPDCRLKG